MSRNLVLAVAGFMWWRKTSHAAQIKQQAEERNGLVKRFNKTIENLNGLTEQLNKMVTDFNKVTLEDELDIPLY